MGAWIETPLPLLSQSTILSHPTWVRGLKRTNTRIYKQLQQVAPYVGAWIETCMFFLCARRFGVAPYVGAWIETVAISLQNVIFSGRTLRGCVDWNCIGKRSVPRLWVAPYVGAWIETTMSRIISGRAISRTLRGCVDWNMLPETSVVDLKSHPTWVRGLKLTLVSCKSVGGYVAPYVGAWIETYPL